MYSTIAANTNLYATAKGVEIEMIDVFSHFIFVHVRIYDLRSFLSFEYVGNTNVNRHGFGT